MMPLVSVIIPTYNHAHFLIRALQSVVDQTYKNIEIIVVDNHSTDNTDEVVRGFDPTEITLLKIHNNGVIGASRNKGIQAAKGEWVAFLDSDDLWYPQKVEKSIEALNRDATFDVISTDELMVNEESGESQILLYGPYQQDFYKTLLVSGNRLSTSATLVKRSFIKKNKILFRTNSEFITAEDYDFWLQLAYSKASFLFVRSVQGEYSIHSLNQSGQITRHFNNVQAVLKDHVFNIQDFTTERTKLFNFIRSRFLVNCAANFIRTGKIRMGMGVFITAFIKSPMGLVKYTTFRLTKKEVF